MRFSTVIMAAQEVKPIFYATDGVWKAIIQLGMIAVLMLIAHVLRRKLPVIRKSLMPVSVIAGFLMLGVKLLLRYAFRIDDLFDTEFLDTIVYHCIALGFIAMSLRAAEKKQSGAALAGAKSGAVIVGSYSYRRSSALR